jgi:hypothetical protein
MGAFAAPTERVPLRVPCVSRVFHDNSKTSALMSRRLKTTAPTRRHTCAKRQWLRYAPPSAVPRRAIVVGGARARRCAVKRRDVLVAIRASQELHDKACLIRSLGMTVYERQGLITFDTSYEVTTGCGVSVQVGHQEPGDGPLSGRASDDGGEGRATVQGESH